MIWHKIKNKKPLAYKSGTWDGLKSDKILVCDKNGTLHISEMYEGILDGSEFCDFYDDRDSEITNIAFWTEIDLPF